MANFIAPTLKQRFFSANGAPLSGGLLYSYVAGTSTPLATYTDSTGATPNTNPIVLDANGQCSMWLSNAYYKFVLEDSGLNVQWTVDQVSQPGTGPTGPTGPAGLIGYDYTFSTATTSTPATGVLNFNNATIASVTNIYVNSTNINSANISSILALIASNAQVVIEDASGSYGVFLASGTASLTGSVYTIPVTFVASFGALTNGETVGFQPFFSATGGGGGGANVTLSNLTSPTAINQNLLPGTPDTYDLGVAVTNRFHSAFFSNIVAVGHDPFGNALPGAALVNGSSPGLGLYDGGAQAYSVCADSNLSGVSVLNPGAGSCLINVQDESFHIYSTASGLAYLQGTSAGVIASTGLTITTTTGALLLPRLSTTQRDALTAVNGMEIYNSTLNKFQSYENGTWINSTSTGGGGTGISRTVSSVSTATTAGSTASTDYVYLVSGTSTITLPTAVSNTNLYTIKNVGVNTVTVAFTGGQNADGSTTISIPTQYTAIDFISNNTNWNIV